MNREPLQFKALTPEEFPRTCEVLHAALSEGVSPGFVVGVWRLQEASFFHAIAVGKRRETPGAQPMELDTVFDLASVSKVFATAMLAAVLVERGWLRWDLPVQAVFSDYRHPDVRVSHLLSHTSGYAAWMPFWEMLRERFAPTALHEIAISERQNEMRKLVFAQNQECAPGERVLYSDLSFILLGYVLEKILQTPLDEAVLRYVWEPMGISGASYRRTNCSASQGLDLRAAATELCSWRGAVIQGQVHDDNCWAMGGYAGHSGAFASIREVMQFSRALFEGFLTPETLDAFWRPVTQPPHCLRTLGWDTPSVQGSSSGSLFSPRSVGHLGFTGTSLWIDPESKIAVALLSNRVHPSRDNIKIRAFRPVFHDAIRLDLFENQAKLQLRI
jgi:CubicO group peptidase (beta-lactamase class C family)